MQHTIEVEFLARAHNGCRQVERGEKLPYENEHPLGYDWERWARHVRAFYERDEHFLGGFNGDVLKVAWICQHDTNGWRDVLHHQRHRWPSVFAVALVASLRHKMRRSAPELSEDELRARVDALLKHDGALLSTTP